MQEYSLYEQVGGIFSRPIVMQNANGCLVGYGVSQLQQQLQEREVAGWNLGEKGLKEGCSCTVLEGGI